MTLKETTFFVYILVCDDHAYYTGYTNDLIKRIATHKLKKGGKYTRSRKDLKLVYFEVHPTKKLAMQREYQIKKEKRDYKKTLVKNFRVTLDNFKDI